MTKTKKIVLSVAVLAIVVALSVGMTLAYLTSEATPVNNTFTVGKVAITLDEAKVTDLGVADGDSRVQANEYKLIPGHEYLKDPTIHVAADSEACWLFVKVTDEIAAIEDTTTVAAQLTTNGWTAVEGATGVYWHAVVNPNGTATDVKVFENFKVKGNADLTNYAGKTIKVEAYAVQADGFDTAAAAWNATFGA